MEMSNKKNATLYYGIIMATYSVGFVTMSAFSSVYLLDIGLSNGAVGILIAIASMVSVLLQPFVGALIDRYRFVSSKRALLCLAIMIAIIGAIIVFVTFDSIVVTSLLYGIDIMMLMLAQPFLNSLGMDAINYGYPINFGLGRSLGSMGYALGSYAFGHISVIAGPRSVPIAFTIAFLVLCVWIVIYPVKTEAKDSDSFIDIFAKENEKKTGLAKEPHFLLKYKRFTVMLLGMIMVYFSHSLINTFSLQIVTTKGGNSSSMGTAAAIAAFCELITMILFPLYLKRFRLNSMLRVACIFFTLKIALSIVVPNVALFYAIQVVQMFGWGIMSIGIVYYVNELVGNYDKAQGQAYAGMSFTIASVIATFTGGNMIDWWGVSTMLVVGTVMAIVGTIIVWISVEDVEVVAR